MATKLHSVFVVGFKAIRFLLLGMLAKDMLRLHNKRPDCSRILPPNLQARVEIEKEDEGNVNKPYAIDEQSEDENEDEVRRNGTSVKLPESCGQIPLFGSRFSLSQYYTPRFVAGGYQAEPGQFPPYVFVRLQHDLFSYSRCGGTLITNRHVLTAAHCARDKEFALVMPTISFYDTYRNDPNLSYKTEKICVASGHEAKNGINFFDYAVLKLNNPIEFNQYVQPACLPDKDLSPKTQAYAVGLGITLKDNDRIEYPEKLQVLPVKKIECSEGDKHISSICFRANDKNFVGDTCAGDSGGPIFTFNKNKLTLNGITSYGPNVCEKGVIGTSVNVHVYNMRHSIIDLLEECA